MILITLADILDCFEKSIEQAKTQTTQQNSGPGEYDQWLVMESRQDAFYVRNQTSRKKEKYKVILSDGLLREKIPDDYLFFFINYLIANKDLFDVYLWAGEKPIENLQAITTTDEFWEKRHTIVPAHADDVEKVLGQQSINKDDYLIFDYYHFIKLKANINGFDVEEIELQAKNILEQSEVYASTHATKVSLENPTQEEIRAVPIVFNDITKLNVKLSNQEYLLDVLDTFSGTDLELIDCEFTENGEFFIRIPKGSNIKSLSLTFKDNPPDNAKIIIQDLRDKDAAGLDKLIVKNFIYEGGYNNYQPFQSNTKIKSLDLYSLSSTAIDLTSLSELESFMISETSQNVLNIALPSSLTHLSSSGATLRINNADELKKLKVLNLHECEPAFIKLHVLLANNPELEHLIFGLEPTSSYSNPTLDLSDMKELKTLEIKRYRSLQKIILPTSLEDIQIESSSGLQEIISKDFRGLQSIEANSTTLNLPKAMLSPNLTMLDIFHYTDECLGQIPYLRNLEKLVVADNDEVQVDLPDSLKNLKYTSTKLKQLNLSPLPLEILTIECPNLKECNLPASLKHLIIQHSNIGQLNLSSLTQLVKVNVTTSENLKEIVFENNTALHSVTLQGYGKSPSAPKLIGATSFQELKYDGYTLAPSDITQAPVTYLEINSCSLSQTNVFTFDLTNNTQLQNLEISRSDLANHLIFIGSHLKNLSISNYRINGKIDLHQLTNLEFLELSNVKVSELNFPSPCPVKYLRIDNANFNNEVLDLSEFTELEILELDFNDIKKVVLPKSSKLKIIYCPNVDIEYINLEYSRQLEKFTAEEIENSNLDFSNMPMLQEVNITRSQQRDLNINLQNCPRLQECEIKAKATLDINLSGSTRLQNLILHSDAVNLKIDPDVKLANINVKSSNTDIVAQYLNNTLQHVPTVYSFNKDNNSASSIPTAEQLSDMMNKDSNVSIFDYGSSMSVDSSSIGKVEKYTDTGHFKVEIVKKHNPSNKNFRISLINTIEYDGKNIHFKSKTTSSPKDIVIQPRKEFLTAPLISKLKGLAKNSDDKVFGFLEGKLLPNMEYTLPLDETASKASILYYTDPPNAVTVIWKAEQQKFVAILNTNVPTDVKIAYLTHTQPNYNLPFRTDNNPVISSQPLLDDVLRQKIEDELQNIPDLDFLLPSSTLTTAEKLEKLAKYILKEYDSKNKITAKFNNTFDELFYQIRECKGVCKDRSQAFMLFAHYLNVPVLINGNETHAYCDIPIMTATGLEYRCQDLGGGEALMLGDPNKRKTAATDIQAAQPVTPQSNTTTPIVAPVAKNTFSDVPNIYDIEFETVAQTNVLSHISQLLEETKEEENKKRQAPLIECTNQYSPLKVHEQLLVQLRKDKFPVHENYLYINRPEDFMMYLTPWQFKDGKYKRIAGPLQKMIDEGGILVINWNNFTPTQIANYKSILDTKATLLGKPVTKKLKIINLANKHTETCSAFTSRCSSWSIDHSFFTSVTPTTQIPAPKANVTIDLYETAAWRKALYGKDLRLSNTKGPLIQAITKGERLILQNPPNDPDFDLLLARLKTERKLLFNGEFIPVHDDFEVVIQKTIHSPKSDNVKISIDANDLLNKDKIYLGIYNFHELFERLQFAGTTINPLDNLLMNYQADQVFYVTENIPRNMWEQLCDYVNANQALLKNKNFKFVLAPGVEITGIAKNPISQLEDEYKAVYKSNDPDLLSFHLSEENRNSVIVDITPAMKFSDLIYETKIESEDSLNYLYLEKGVLKALAEGKTVILNGVRSASMYQQLLPFLQGKKKVNYNGKEIEIKGKLLVVLAPEANFSQVMSCEEYNYYPEEYKTRLIEESDGNKEHYENIELFLQFVTKLPHQGIGRPTKPKFNYQRLEKMLSVLNRKEQLHRNNPIKSVFNYDYPRYSKDYAYLNVIGKMIFGDVNAKRYINYKKLQKLYKRYDINSYEKFVDHTWEILNCCNRNYLEELLGQDITKMLAKSAGFPNLRSDLLQELHLFFSRINEKLEGAKLKPKTTHKQDKYSTHLQYLLNDKKTPFIFLKGAAGVGKTHLIRKKLGVGNYYEGKEGILEWLRHPDKILYIDEANLYKPGMLDFLKAIARKDKIIYYNDDFYDLNFDANNPPKVVISGNPENYPNREYHQLFQDYAETIYLDKPSAKELKEDILIPLLKPYNLDDKEYLDFIVYAYKLFSEYNPFILTSIRDLENVAQRFIVLATTQKLDPMNALLLACTSEFAGAIVKPKERSSFIEELENKIGRRFISDANDTTIVITPDHILPTEKAALVSAIEQDLLMRQWAIDHTSAGVTPYYKSAVLIEGGPGVGKSNTFRAIIQRKINEALYDAGNPPVGSDKYNEIMDKWDYVELSGADDNLKSELKKAFHAGKLVVLDELNLTDEIEALLNEYLTGYDEEGNLAEKPGFMIFASQNTSTMAGRKTLSPALRNRTHFVYMDNFSDHELEAVASHISQQPKDVVSAHRRAERKYPHTNERTFFKVFDNIKKRDGYARKTVPHSSRTIANDTHFKVFKKQKKPGSSHAIKSHSKKIH